MASPLIRHRHGPIGRRLLAMLRQPAGSAATLGALMDRLGPQGPGMVLLMLALPTLVPLPGPVGMVLGTVIALVVVQLGAGAERVWLPGRLRALPVGAQTLRQVVRRTLPLTGAADRLLQEQRWPRLAGPAGRWLTLPLLLAMAVIIVLPVPFGNVVPAMAIIVMAGGMIAADGLALLAGVALAGAAGGVTVWLVGAGAAAIGQLARLTGLATAAM
jgi:hypothetical protein